MSLHTVFYDVIESVSRLSGPIAYCTIVGILLVCGLGVPIPEDITLVAAGLLASGGDISLSGAFAAGFIGVLSGDSMLFFLGRRFGKSVFRLPGIRRLFTPERTAAAEARIRKNGPFICFVARFLPGLRAPIFAMSGALGVRPATFVMLDGLAALLSVPLWVYVGYWFGENFEDASQAALEAAKHVQGYIFASIGCVIVAYVSIKIYRKKRRQLLESKSVAPCVTENK